MMVVITEILLIELTSRLDHQQKHISLLLTQVLMRFLLVKNHQKLSKYPMQRHPVKMITIILRIIHNSVK